jgi:hypothetical protein
MLRNIAALLALFAVFFLGSSAGAYAFSQIQTVNKNLSSFDGYVARVGATEEINKRVNPRHRCRYYHRYGSLRRYCER